MRVHKYDNVVSLGHFCGVAMEMERYGLRKGSYPFDWLITGDFESVIYLINNNFDQFFDNLHFIEGYEEQGYVRNDQFQMDFYHDFSGDATVEAQLEGVKAKYQRRIDALYESMHSRTLFIRYINSREEYNWIMSNEDYINSSIKKYNFDNDIIYIGSDYGNAENMGRYYVVEPDEGDTVARKFTRQRNLRKIFMSIVLIDLQTRAKNIFFYLKKKAKR